MSDVSLSDGSSISLVSVHSHSSLQVPATRNELLAPPVAPVTVHIPADTPLIPIAAVTALVETSLVLESIAGMHILDLDSVILSHARLPLGRVFDTFGPVTRPLYTVLFNSNQELVDTLLEPGHLVYYIPGLATHVQPSTLNSKGTDASNINDEELVDAEFSDDEQEMMHKSMLKKQRKQQAQKDPDNPFLPVYSNQPRKQPSNQRAGNGQDSRFLSQGTGSYSQRPVSGHKDSYQPYSSHSAQQQQHPNKFAPQLNNYQQMLSQYPPATSGYSSQSFSNQHQPYPQQFMASQSGAQEREQVPAPEQIGDIAKLLEMLQQQQQQQQQAYQAHQQPSQAPAVSQHQQQQVFQQPPTTAMIAPHFYTAPPSDPRVSVAQVFNHQVSQPTAIIESAGQQLHVANTADKHVFGIKDYAAEITSVAHKQHDESAQTGGFQLPIPAFANSEMSDSEHAFGIKDYAAEIPSVAYEQHVESAQTGGFQLPIPAFANSEMSASEQAIDNIKKNANPTLEGVDAMPVIMADSSTGGGMEPGEIYEQAER